MLCLFDFDISATSLVYKHPSRIGIKDTWMGNMGSSVG